MASYGHLFNTQAASYAAHRPTYPPQLYQAIYNFAALKSKDLALDIATGSGQAAKVLAESFKKVIAQDVSQGQLDEAIKNASAPNISYGLAKAEDTGVASGSVDLVTVAQALHWFDLPAFYKEVRRVLRPTGAFVAWGYDLSYFPGNDKATSLMREYYEWLGPYWSDRRTLIDEQYRGMVPGQEHFQTVEYKLLETPVSSTMTLPALEGYLKSWSAHATYCREHPDRPDPIINFKADFKQAMGLREDSQTFTMEWPLFLILAKEPRSVKTSLQGCSPVG